MEVEEGRQLEHFLWEVLSPRPVSLPPSGKHTCPLAREKKIKSASKQIKVGGDWISQLWQDSKPLPEP